MQPMITVCYVNCPNILGQYGIHTEGHKQNLYHLIDVESEMEDSHYADGLFLMGINQARILVDDSKKIDSKSMIWILLNKRAL